MHSFWKTAGGAAALVILVAMAVWLSVITRRVAKLTEASGRHVYSIDPTLYGAAGDESDATSAFTAAAAAAKAISTRSHGTLMPYIKLPCGTYRVETSIALGQTAIRGEGKACTRILTGNLGSLFTITVPPTGLAGNTYRDFTVVFTGPTNSDGAKTYASAFEITGGKDGGQFNQNTFSNLRFFGFYAALKVAKPSFVTRYGYEAPFNVNTLTNIEVEDYRAKAKYGIWMLGGSGTGNLYDRMLGAMQAKGSAILRIEGSCRPASGCAPVEDAQTVGGNVVGDIKLENADISLAAFMSVGSGAVYNDNFDFVGSQFDGDTPPLHYDDPPMSPPRGLRTCSTNMGGKGLALTIPIEGSVSCDRDASQTLTGAISAAVKTLDVTGDGANQVRGVELHLAPDSATMIEVTISGGGFQAGSPKKAVSRQEHIGSSGGLVVTAKYLVQRGRGPIRWAIVPGSCSYLNEDGNNGLCGSPPAGPGSSTGQHLRINVFAHPADDPYAIGINALFNVQEAAAAPPFPFIDVQVRTMGGRLFVTR